MVNPGLTNWLLGIGLLLDIVGVVVLAVPDIPVVSRGFRFGRVREALESLQQGLLGPDNTGFEDIVELQNEMSERVGISPEDMSQITFEHRIVRDYNSGDGEVTGVTEWIEFEYVEGAEHEGPFIPWASPPARFYPQLLRVVERGERRSRLAGLALIAGGFALQLVAVGLG